MLPSDYFFEDRKGIKLLYLKRTRDCEETVEKITYLNSDERTVIFLSGGSTPKKLYEKFTLDRKLKAGAVGMVDERYGDKWHDTSNEKMIKETGLLDYLKEKSIRFYPILGDASQEDTSLHLDETLHYLFSYFQKSMAILGVGSDGHTAGVPAIPDIAKKIANDPSSLSAYYLDKNKYGERVTMTFLALSQIDILLLLVLGTEKREALKAMFEVGPVEEVPARFYLKPEIAKKTILITDQKI